MPAYLPVINLDTLNKAEEFLGELQKEENTFVQESGRKSSIKIRYDLAFNALRQMQSRAFMEAHFSNGECNNKVYEEVFTRLTTIAGLVGQFPASSATPTTKEQHRNLHAQALRDEASKRIGAFANFFLGQFYFFGADIEKSKNFFVPKNKRYAFALFKKAQEGGFQLANHFMTYYENSRNLDNESSSIPEDLTALNTQLESVCAALTPKTPETPQETDILIEQPGQNSQRSDIPMRISKAALNSDNLDFNPFAQPDVFYMPSHQEVVANGTSYYLPVFHGVYQQAQPLPEHEEDPFVGLRPTSASYR